MNNKHKPVLRRAAAVAMSAAVALAAAVAGVAQAQTATANGEVAKIDAAAGRVTLKHGEIKSLDMPPMTMAYKVRDAKMLDGLAVGDRVRFAAEKLDGQYMVTSLSKAP